MNEQALPWKRGKYIACIHASGLLKRVTNIFTQKREECTIFRMLCPTEGVYACAISLLHQRVKLLKDIKIDS
jgi:hypothetical protein